MTGDFRDFVSKIRCVCLVDEYENLVSVEESSPLYQQPVLTVHFTDPNEAGADQDNTGADAETKGSKDKSPGRQGKRKRGDKGAPRESEGAVVDRSALFCAMVTYATVQ